MLRNLISLLVFVFSLCCHLSTGLAQATPVDAGHSSIELITEAPTLVAGQMNSFAIVIKPKKTWHSYWVNPGDAGKSVQVNWDIPQGVTISTFKFPAPKLVPFMGMVSYGYDEKILVLFDVFIPKKYQENSYLPISGIPISGIANWLVCDDELCVPQQAEISLDLQLGEVGTRKPRKSRKKEFDIARSKVPVRVDWPATYSKYVSNQVIFHIEILEQAFPISKMEFFPLAKKAVQHPSVKRVLLATKDTVFIADRGQKFDQLTNSDIVLVMTGQNGARQAYIMAIKDGDLSAISSLVRESLIGDGSAPQSLNAKSQANPTGYLGTLFMTMGFAILGGLLLNLMPCVLPVLSLKALSLAKLKSEDLKSARINGLVYTLGVLASFLLFGIVLAALRGAGSYAGWGFQMQHPAILVVLVLLIGAIGANLAGWLDVSISFTNNTGQKTTHGSGYKGSGYKSEFFTGVLAVVVAAPCTAPFMGGALGYALTQPLLITLLVFLSLGMGLALPYLLLCYFPLLRRWLPTPGAWMNSFKQFLAFPMFATVIWLLWVLGHQVGLQYVLAVLVLALLLSMAIWAKRKAGESSKKLLWNVFFAAVLACAVFTSYSLSKLKETKQQLERNDALNSEIYSLEKLENLLADNQSVFVYFTADWCITCKVNEKAALYKPAIAASFAEKNIHVLVGDWTNPDDDIAKILKRFGRVGVPLYLYYAPGVMLDDAKILPQILTTKTILNALEE